MMSPPFQWQVVQAVLDPVEGSEQGGARPVVIVSRETANRRLPIITVAPLTTHRPPRQIYPSEVLLAAGKGGQPNESRVIAHQLRTISKSRVVYSYGWITDEVVREQIRAAIRTHLDLD